ncbi:hypothetical protein M436DRAFT_42812 [Aureobasidium namibiae CBS 147.97]|uniref:DNA (cytosine-5)-methyltransferase 1 replication foci domain-containing protein n=1 Tax=Aureobasidium namibiae CBS 147.97 TaxID=1043004 RepID=A0A074XK36_9PEZI
MTAESSILCPRDPSQLNSDEWPEFELKQAFVYDPEDPTRAPASLLHAGQYRPLTITGKLEPPNSHNIGSWLDNTARRAVQIDLTDIKEFSYGEYGDGSLDIWAAGQAGWFTIKPSRAYQDTYSDMTQALKLLYFMADSYKAQKKYADLSAPHFFKKCSEANLEGCKDVADVAEMFTKHRHFLIASMLMNKENLQWSRVPLYTWLQVTFPNDFVLVQTRIKPPRAKSSQNSASQSPAASTASARRKKATAKQQSSTPKSAVFARSARSTRSTRSQSNATLDSLPMVLDNSPEVEQILEIVSTTTTPRTHVDQNMSSSDDEIRTTGGKGKGKSALRPRPSKFAPRANNISKGSPTAIQSKRAAGVLPDSLGPDVMSVDNPATEIEESSDRQIEEISEGSDDDKAIATKTRETSLPFRFEDAANNGDVWHCPVDGCMHKTYAASEPSSQLLIKRHSQAHDFDHDKRVQLVRRMEAPYLPVNRLMDRVRGMAASSKFPPPITQRY